MRSAPSAGEEGSASSFPSPPEGERAGERGTVRARWALCALLAAGWAPVALAAAPAEMPAAPRIASGAATWPGRLAPRDLAALRLALDAVLDRPPLRAAGVGVQVVSLDTGQEVYARGADRQLNPASNVKLFTSAALLARLGPGYAFTTRVEAAAAPRRGEVADLFVVGRGDPTFVTERLWLLAGDLARRGVRRVLGDVVVDDAWFDGERQGPGYDQEVGDRAYLAPIGALALNFAAVEIHVGPGERPGAAARVALEPASEHLVLQARVSTVAAGGSGALRYASRPLPDGRQLVEVQGQVGVGDAERVVWRRVDDPALYFGATLKRLLALRGVEVKGRVRRGLAPEGTVTLATSSSEGLGAIVRKLEKLSSNFVAEQLLKALGAELSGAPGSWPKGVAAVEGYLTEAGLAPGSYLLRNGSGLNDANRFSARQVVTVLRDAWRRFPVMADFVAALPVAGRDGTTRTRMPAAAGRLRAKTGSLAGAVSLSGYVETAAGERLAFSVLVNDFRPGERRAAVRAIDALGEALAAAGSAPEVSGGEPIDGQQDAGEMEGGAPGNAGDGRVSEGR